MRAIEQGRYLARAANTGISGIVDPYGRVLARSALFETAVITEEVRLLQGLTFYGRIGDLIAYLCSVMTVAAVGAAWHARRRARASGRTAPPRPPPTSWLGSPARSWPSTTCG